MSLIIDCDPGNGIPGANVDDALALCLAWSAPQLDLKSIWTVFGNVSAREGTEAAQRLATTFGKNTHIVTGCDAPLDTYISRTAWREKLDAPRFDADIRKLWGEYDSVDAEVSPASETIKVPCEVAAQEVAAQEVAAQEVAARLAKDLLKQAEEGPVTVAALGPLTNIAALIHFEPEAAKCLAEIRIMGGCLGYDDLVDTNFAVDPLAAAIVFNSGIKTTLVPLDVTRTTHFSLERWEQIRAQVGNSPQLRRKAMGIDTWLSPWIRYSKRTRPVDGMWVHDMVVIAQLIYPDLVEERQERVFLAEHPRGKLVSPKDMESSLAFSDGNEKYLTKETEVQMVTAVDNEKLLALWAQIVFGE